MPFPINEINGLKIGLPKSIPIHRPPSKQVLIPQPFLQESVTGMYYNFSLENPQFINKMMVLKRLARKKEN